MFGLRALWRFGYARTEGQVGRLLGIFLMICGVLHCIIVKDVKFRGVAIGLEFKEKCLPTGCEF